MRRPFDTVSLANHGSHHLKSMTIEDHVLSSKSDHLANHGSHHRKSMTIKDHVVLRNSDLVPDPVSLAHYGSHHQKSLTIEDHVLSSNSDCLAQHQKMSKIKDLVPSRTSDHLAHHGSHHHIIRRIRQSQIISLRENDASFPADERDRKRRKFS